MKKTNLQISLTVLTALLFVVAVVMTSCKGKDGEVGPAGANGLDANETCKLCHNSTVVEAAATEFELSKHSWGEAAFEEAGNATCGPCHLQEAYKYVVENNIPATFTLNTGTGKYVNDYAATTGTAIGEISCFTCHNSLHTTYGSSDLPALTTTSAVSMTMWKGAKSINLTQDGGISNLCVRCHQPRPMTKSSSLSDGDVVDYADLVANPTQIWYDSAVGNAAPNVHLPSYRMHVHYGAVGAVFAGVGGVEFTGVAYSNSAHTTAASCQDCHMASIYGRAGGHTFNVRNAFESALGNSTTWNFNGCNATDCHGAGTVSSTNVDYWVTPRSEVKTLLNDLAAKINALGGGTDILHKNSDATSNLWAGLTTNNYDGYLDIYSSSSNPSGYWRDPANTSATNMAKPKFPSLTKRDLGAIINFQFALREYSLGIHNFKYISKLLENTIALYP